MEDYKFLWTEQEMEQAADLLNSGVKPSEVAEIMNEKIIDVGLLLIHLIDTGKVKSKKKNVIK